MLDAEPHLLVVTLQEALYDDDLSAHLHATAAIAGLAEHHLATVAAHPTLLPALARLLRENHKRSSELALNLLTTFLLLSHQPAHRSLLVQVGGCWSEMVENFC